MEKIKKLLEEKLKEKDLIIDSIEMVEENNEKILRIIIDNDTSVDLETCVMATHLINEVLDEKDPIKEKYVLEVLSKIKGGN